MRIVFMGSPDFAVPALDRLRTAGYEIVGVITATDKKGGRGGKQILKTAVKQYAEEHKLHILQPKNLKSPKFVEELRALKADLQIVVAFRMLPEIVWNMPGLGTYNIHGSLLPKYRGAAPIHWAVINGEKQTGVTSFKLKHKIDTGDFLFQESLDVGPDDTTGIVYEKLRFLGADLIIKTVKAIESDNYQLIPQDESLVSKAPKIYKETCEIDWNQDVQTVYNFVRGMSPFPTAWTKLDELQFKIIESRKLDSMACLEPGVFSKHGKHGLKISCINGYILPKLVQLQGKRRMKIEDFMNGFSLDKNTSAS